MLPALHITVQENVIDVKVLKMFKYKSLKKCKDPFSWQQKPQVYIGLL